MSYTYEISGSVVEEALPILVNNPGLFIGLSISPNFEFKSIENARNTFIALMKSMETNNERNTITMLNYAFQNKSSRDKIDYDTFIEGLQLLCGSNTGTIKEFLTHLFTHFYDAHELAPPVCSNCYRPKT